MRDETMKKYFKIEFIRNRRLVENYNNWNIYIYKCRVVIFNVNHIDSASTCVLGIRIMIDDVE